jgi:hypothetical protein
MLLEVLNCAFVQDSFEPRHDLDGADAESADELCVDAANDKGT